MVEITGSLVQQREEDGDLVTVFRIPAFSASLARRRAMQNARFKDYASPEVEQTENAGKGDLPGQKIFLVSVRSNR